MISGTGSEPSEIAVSGETRYWVSNQGDATVSRIDAPSGDRIQTIKVGNGPSGLAVTNRGVWVVNTLDATVSRIEPRRGIVAATIPVDARPAGIAASAGSIWVSDAETGRVYCEIDARRGAVVSLRRGRGPRRTDPRYGSRPMDRRCLRRCPAHGRHADHRIHDRRTSARWTPPCSTT